MKKYLITILKKLEYKMSAKLSNSDDGALSFNNTEIILGLNYLIISLVSV